MRNFRTGLWVVAFTLVCQFAQALDVDEIALLIRRDVDESTIMEIIRNRPLTQPLSATDVVALHNAGATSRLLGFLTSPEASMPESLQYAVPVTPTPVVTSPPLTYAPPATCAPTYVVPAPVAPPVVVYRSYPSYPRYSFSFGFGGGRGWGHDRYRHRGGRRGHRGRW